MPRRNRGLKRLSVFVPEKHIEIVAQLAYRKGVTSSDIFRAMLKKYLVSEVQKIAEEKSPEPQE